MENAFQDILMYEEMQKQCWKLFSEATSLPQKLRALSCLRGSSSDKLRMLHNIPLVQGFLRAHNSKFEWAPGNEKQEKNLTVDTLKQHENTLKEINKKAKSLDVAIKNKLGIKPLKPHEFLQAQNQQIIEAIRNRQQAKTPISK